MEFKEEVVEIKLCEVCGVEARKYKCPRCSVFSCSLACCKRHKVEKECCGKREQSSYISLNQMKDGDLRRDYHFLENVLARKDGAKRTLSQSLGGLRDNDSQKRQGGVRSKIKNMYKRARSGFGAEDVSNIEMEQNLDMHKMGVRRLVKACKERNCSLKVMSPGMSRRELNTSRFLQKKDLVIWRVQLVFVASRGGAARPQDLLQSSLDCLNQGAISTQGGLVGICLEGIEENCLIKDFLAPLIDNVAVNNSSEAQRHALRYLRSHREDVVCLLQQIPSPTNNPAFIAVEETKSLREALNSMSVLEYPVLYVGLASDTEHLRRNIEELPDTDTDKGIEVDADDGNEEEEEVEEEEGDEDKDFMAELEEMGRKDIKDLQAIIREEGEP